MIRDREAGGGTGVQEKTGTQAWVIMIDTQKEKNERYMTAVTQRQW